MAARRSGYIHDEFVSVAMEEEPQDWLKKVYKADIKNNWDKVYNKPEYGRE